MTRGARWTLGLLVAWTLFVWGTRISNALGGTESTSDKVVSIVLSVTFVALAVASAWLLVRLWRGGVLDRSWAAMVATFAAWTTAVWLVRMTTIALSDNTAAFKVVHVVLGLVSIGLAITPGREAVRRWSAPVAAH